jgi:hypothetical protein
MLQRQVVSGELRSEDPHSPLIGEPPGLVSNEGFPSSMGCLGVLGTYHFAHLSPYSVRENFSANLCANWHLEHGTDAHDITG